VPPAVFSPCIRRVSVLVEYKGKKLQAAPKIIGKLEVVTVEPDLCYARILSSERPLKQDDKVVEKNEASI
jgi:hypothetical protein